MEIFLIIIAIVLLILVLVFGLLYKKTLTNKSLKDTLFIITNKIFEDLCNPNMTDQILYEIYEEMIFISKEELVKNEKVSKKKIGKYTLKYHYGFLSESFIDINVELLEEEKMVYKRFAVLKR